MEHASYAFARKKANHCLHRLLDKNTRRSESPAEKEQNKNSRKLHTQYVEGIYRPKYYIVTLKCGLEERLLKVIEIGTI